MGRFQEIFSPGAIVQSVFNQGSADGKCDSVGDLTATKGSTDFNDAFCRGKDLSIAGFLKSILIAGFSGQKPQTKCVVTKLIYLSARFQQVLLRDVRVEQRKKETPNSTPSIRVVLWCSTEALNALESSNSPVRNHFVLKAAQGLIKCLQIVLRRNPNRTCEAEGISLENRFVNILIKYRSHKKDPVFWAVRVVALMKSGFEVIHCYERDEVAGL
ncbi:hypothetical protein E4U12_008078 [Claviceps purpurea]|nr:hypothetical protein E4U12_008078 [Claviceps purpurea]